MTIRVQANHKYIDEIQSMVQIFFPHARFGSDSTPEYIVVSTIENGKIHAKILPSSRHREERSRACRERSVAEAIQHFGKHTITSDNYPTIPSKRLAMLAMYRLLQSTIGAYTPWGALTGVRPTKMVREWLANGQSETEILRTLQSTFHVTKSRADLALTVAQAENRLTAQIKDTGLYVSIPFCPSRCVYCSFNTSSGQWSEAAQILYITALISELRKLTTTLNETGSKISSIYIGGGTPTALTDTQLEALLSAIQEVVPVPKEYTIEAGRPDTITRENLQLMRKYGANRISINPQTLNENTLKIIGRNHTTTDFLRAYNQAREEGFTTINTDIIAGLPYETPKDTLQTMETLANLNPENITVHTLAVKRASKLNEQRLESKTYTKPAAEIIESQLKIAHEACNTMGHSPYYLYRQKNMAALFENTGYSLPGHECLYNIGMMSEVQTVLGVGAGAVSKYIEGTKITRKFNVKNPEIYINRAMPVT